MYASCKQKERRVLLHGDVDHHTMLTALRSGYSVRMKVGVGWERKRGTMVHGPRQVSGF